MNIICIIPARGNSKEIIDKNIIKGTTNWCRGIEIKKNRILKNKKLIFLILR